MNGKRAAIAAIGVITAAAAAVRLPSLRALPIFGDEAIFLRLAGIIRAEPLQQLWSPLRAPSAPLHPWLLALSLPVSSDPVRSGRLLSVLCGVLLVPALAWAAWRLTGVVTTEAGRLAPATSVAAAVLAAASPFLVFSDRIARVDSLFALETALAAGLALSLAGRPSSRAAVLFGLLMGLTMLTRQAVSYPLWLLPLAACLVFPRREGMRISRAIFVAIPVALVLWVPMLVAPGAADLATRIFHVSSSRPSLGFPDRAALVAQNAGIAGAAFWTYLTPAVCLAAVAGLAIAAAMHRRLFWFLAAWVAIVLLPPLLFAVDYFPRYALPAALPLLVAGGVAVASAGIRWGRWLAAALLALLVGWGGKDVWRGVTDWRRWALLPLDRRQFVSGWSAGFASESTADFLVGLSRGSPIWVILPKVSGNPSDAIWRRLDGEPDIRLFYAEDLLTRRAVTAGEPGRARLQGDIWAGRPVETVMLDPAASILFVSPDPVFLGRAGWAPAGDFVLARNPGARLLARFENPRDSAGAEESAVSVFRLR
ncbi:MAG TPA: glycosyltransferase family 39 protein [Thermoanaerobaculia bacterium]|nr:glycosyltransferase family 39 protein [Thermoanaerobaculia bacterium]